jgi:hypothetical protein
VDDTAEATPRPPRRRRKQNGETAAEVTPNHQHGHHARATTLKHNAEIAHHTPGRVRLKIPRARDNPALLMQIKEAFANVPGIEAIELKPSSGSVVLHYDPDHQTDIPSFFRPVQPPPDPAPRPHRPPKGHLDEVTSSIEEEAEFLAEHSAIAKSVVTYCKELDKWLKQATGNNIDLKIMVPIGLAAVTFLEVGAAAATPMWVTLVIFSLNHFVELHAHDADGEQS